MEHDPIAAVDAAAQEEAYELADRSARLLDDEYDGPMTAAELRVVREHLGLTTRWLAEHLHVAERSVHRWESGAQAVPDGVRLAVEQLEADTAVVVTAAIEVCDDARDPALITYRTDDEYRAHHPDQPWPASWHRAVAARVAQEVPGLVIDYWQPE